MRSPPRASHWWPPRRRPSRSTRGCAPPTSSTASSAWPSPTAHRAELLRLLLRACRSPTDVDLRAVAERTPGFVAADLVALRREAAVPAALRRGDDTRVAQEDLLGAVGSVRPVSMSSSETLQSGGLTLDQVGDMVEVKQALTETVLWPLQYPDSFARLGVDPPRGVLVYGPPGCGKTFLMRALAGTGQLNVFGSRARSCSTSTSASPSGRSASCSGAPADAAPALVFLDEVDALAPRRGRSTDSGVADRVVAALLTELDGAEPLRDVVVLGATNRPELIDPALLRPGRLERLDLRPAAGRRRPRRDPARRAAAHPAGRRRRPRRAGRRARGLLGGRLRGAGARGGADGDARVAGRRRR